MLPSTAVAHPVPGVVLDVERCEDCDGTGQLWLSGIFYAFRPKRIVRIIPTTMPEPERMALRDQGLTLVVVPRDDPDHQPGRQRGEDEE